MTYATERPRLFWGHHSVERLSYRAWLYCRGREFFRCQFATGHAGLKLDVDDEDWTLFFGIWLFSVWLSTPGPRKWRPREDMTIGFTLHNGAIWWDLWHTSQSWHSTTPAWRHGNFNPVDFFFGRRDCTHTLVEQAQVMIPMPEKAYPATAKLEDWRWKRPRWPFAEQFKRVTIDIPNGIPFPGKGENSWDCGDDATFGITTGKCNSIAEGVGVLVGSVLRDRVRHGGWSDWTWKRDEDAPRKEEGFV